MKKLLSFQYFDEYQKGLPAGLKEAFQKIQEKPWNPDSFKFYTAVSVMASAKIEGEPLEIDSYLKHKTQDVAYLPNLTQKPNDLFEAYEFARDHSLNLSNFLKIHQICTQNLLPETSRGKLRKGNMLIMNQQTQQIQYEAALGSQVKSEFEQFWKELSTILTANLTFEETFFFASLIHLVFVKIHPFEDGNGRTARLLEKWFLCQKLGDKAWFIPSEYFYFNHLTDYYRSLGTVGLFYEKLDYSRSIPFLQMLPKAIKAD
jgi:Fic family protein